MEYKPCFNSLKFVWCFFVLGIVFNLTAQPSPNRVIIMGTNHDGNKQLTIQSMLNMVKRINPDILLLEYDSTIISNCNIDRVWGVKTAEFLGIWKNPLEYRVARKYKEIKDSVCIAPFDIYIPNRQKYIDYLATMEYSHLQALKKMNADGLLSNEDKNDFNQYDAINDAIINLLDSSLLIMNRPSLTDTIENVIYKEKHLIRRITMNYPSLQPYSNWFSGQVDYWEERSKGINNNILKALNANSNKTILIITGLMHKSDIENFLRKKELASLCTVIHLQDALMNPPVPDF